MRKILAVAVLAATVATPIARAGIPAERGTERAGSYIVVLKDGTDPRTVANDHAREHAAEVSSVYSTVLSGYAAVIPEARLDDIRSDGRVAYVEPDGIATIVHHCKGKHYDPVQCADPGPSPTPTPDPDPTPTPDPVCPGAQTTPWGIVAIHGTTNSTAAGDCTGTFSGVNVYVIDTGIADHPDLNSTQAVNFAGGQNADCNGHGTHVAGTIGAMDNFSHVVGVAPGVNLIGVKVLGCNGSGSYSGVIDGIEWVTEHASGFAVANMSLGGPASSAVDTAVRNSAASGVFYALAAGNEGTNACNRTPARVGSTTAGVLTVGATDPAGNDPSWSNYGSCVEIWAPGVGVLSTSRNGGTTTMSGTSMATPHVAGGAALAGGSASGAETALRNSRISTGKTANSNSGTIMLLDVGGF